MDTAQNRDYSEPNLSDLLRSLWSIKLYWGLGILIGALLGGAFQVNVQPYYEAQIVVGPVSRGGDVSLSDQQMGARSSVDEDGAAFDFLQYQQIFTSSQAAERLLAFDDKRYLQGIRQDCVWKSCLNEDVLAWDVYQLSDYLKRQVQTYSVGETVLRSLRYRHVDPAFAEDLLRNLDLITNDIVRERVIDKAEKRIDYLQKSMGEVSNPEHRRVFAELLLQQERELMMARLDEGYAAQKVLPATRKGDVVWPQSKVFVSLFVAGFFVLGLVVGGLKRSNRGL